MASRRTFIKHALTGSAALAAYSLPSASRVLGANDRIRIGLFGGGGRGGMIRSSQAYKPRLAVYTSAHN